MYISREKSKTLGKSLHLSPFTLLAYRINNWEVKELWQSCCGGQASAASTCCHGCCPGFQTHWTWWWGTELSIPIKISSRAPKVNETTAPRERDRKSCLNIYLTEYPQRDRAEMLWKRGVQKEKQTITPSSANASQIFHDCCFTDILLMKRRSRCFAPFFKCINVSSDGWAECRDTNLP